MVKKSFFREATKAEIVRKKQVEKPVMDLDPNEYLIIRADDLIPEHYPSPRKFMKHGPGVNPQRVYSLSQSIRENRTPLQRRAIAFNGLESHTFCGYSLTPTGNDRRKRKISLTTCLEGARIFAYAHQTPGAKIFVKVYGESRRVETDGANAIIKIPSRTDGSSRYEFRLFPIPIIDVPEKHLISQRLNSDHACSAKRFGDIRYTLSDSRKVSEVVNICPHEYAGEMAVIEQLLDRKKNLIPLQMCQLAIPSQETVNYYLLWANNVLVYDESLTTKDKLRKPNRAEREIGLWMLVEKFSHDRTFFSKASRDGHLGNYNWKRLEERK